MVYYKLPCQATGKKIIYNVIINVLAVGQNRSVVDSSFYSANSLSSSVYLDRSFLSSQVTNYITFTVIYLSYYKLYFVTQR